MPRPSTTTARSPIPIAVASSLRLPLAKRTFTNVDYPKARFGTALVGVNDSGVVAGNRFVGDKALGFIYEDGVFKNIVYTGAKYTMAAASTTTVWCQARSFIPAPTAWLYCDCK